MIPLAVAPKSSPLLSHGKIASGNSSGGETPADLLKQGAAGTFSALVLSLCPGEAAIPHQTSGAPPKSEEPLARRAETKKRAEDNDAKSHVLLTSLAPHGEK